MKNNELNRFKAKFREMELIVEELASQVNKKDELWLEAQQDI